MPPPAVKQTSSGGIIVRRQDDRYEVCLILRDRHGAPAAASPDRSGGGAWCLPKGHLEPGESPEAAAVREVREETGLYGEILEPLGRIAYRFTEPGNPTLYDKTVFFFLMRAVGGSVDGHDDEALEARWMAFAEAHRLASYANERKLLAKAETLLAQPAVAARVSPA